LAKFLLFLAVIAVIYFVVRAANRRGKPPTAGANPESMVRCAHCGVHFPSAEAVTLEGRDYCSEEHRRLGAGH
jgi:uncharacterized protein